MALLLPAGESGLVSGACPLLSEGWALFFSASGAAIALIVREGGEHCVEEGFPLSGTAQMISLEPF